MSLATFEHTRRGVLTLANRVSQLGDLPGLQAYMGRMMERPAAKKAFGG